MVNLNEAYVIGSESILSLYPILIKSIPTNIPTQLFSRLVTYSVAGGAVASKEDLLGAFGSVNAIAKSLALGLLTCAHVYVSYVAFSSLSAGVAMALFYTYPIWNLILGKLLYSEAIHSQTYMYMITGVLGTFLLSTKGLNDDIKGFTKNSYGAVLGVAAALAAALTETAMYFSVKTNAQQTPWASMLELYGGALLCMIPAVLLKIIPIDFSMSIWIPIVFFNLLVGFTGYALRFYTIPKVSTEVFGLLSYTGVISAFIFGYIFMKEKPSLLSLLGAGMIAFAASHIESVKNATA
jgi:drug/metabolite transporter (DMT)-like permease